MANAFAPPGTIYVCGACGKTSDNEYGEDTRNGWDESCMLHAVLCEDKKRFDPMGVYGWVRSGAEPLKARSETPAPACSRRAL